MENNQELAPKKLKTVIPIAIVAVLALIIGGILFANANAAEPGPDATPLPTASPTAVKAPANLTPEGGIVVTGTAPKQKAPEVVVYLDFICPACQQFDMLYGPTLQKMAAEGDISLEYRPISILDRASTTNYSSRAMNSFACVAETNPKVAVDYINKLMDEQPEEGGSGLLDDELATHAESVGAAGIQSCVTDKKYRDWVNTSSEKALNDGLDHTPYIVINGEVWDGEKDLLQVLSAAS